MWHHLWGHDLQAGLAKLRERAVFLGILKIHKHLGNSQTSAATAGVLKLAYELDWLCRAASWCLKPAGHQNMCNQWAGKSWAQMVLWLELRDLGPKTHTVLTLIPHAY